ncbi:MAG: alkaline phosphatase family protein [Promethearchaeota archaeon]
MNRLNHIIFCIIDDVRSSFFFDLIEKGFLPNFRRLMENGIYSKNCITDFPSVTFPTQASMITGTFTGDFRKEPCHGVPSFNWLDRAFAPPRIRSYMTYGTDKRIQIYKINDDIGDNCQTLLEMVGDVNTASITQFINRGATYFYPERKSKLAMYYLLLRHTRRVEHNIWKANTMVVKKLYILGQKRDQWLVYCGSCHLIS